MIISACRTDFGWVGIAASGEGLLGVTLPQATEADALQVLKERHGAGEPDDGQLDELKGRLVAYFRGQVVSFDGERLDMRRATEFQRAVWQATRAIPRRQTRTYGEIARQAGSPAAARAVGQAMAHNPWPIIVPCHRVLGHGGRLTGFGGGLEMKERLLQLERGAI
jgi:methylated-DNA-[protein]-cysteine S-methyltransferase